METHPSGSCCLPGKRRDEDTLTNASGVGSGWLTQPTIRWCWNVWYAPPLKGRCGSAKPAVPGLRNLCGCAPSVEPLCIMKELVSVTQRSKNDQLAHYGFGLEVMARTKLCPACETLVTDAAQACPACGSALPPLTLLVWYEQHPHCTCCGVILREDSRYCPHCGKIRAKARP